MRWAGFSTDVATLPDADNTLIIYIVGDNGASAEGGFDGTLNENAFFNAHLMKYDEMLNRIDEIGTERHFNHFPAGWAHAMDTPFQWTKQVASHLGGTRNPMIVKWPARFDHGGEVRTQFSHVIDVAPTILAAAGVEEPRSVNGTAQTPIQGRSFLDVLDNADAPEFRTSQYFEIFAIAGSTRMAGGPPRSPSNRGRPSAARSTRWQQSGNSTISTRISARRTIWRTSTPRSLPNLLHSGGPKPPPTRRFPSTGVERNVSAPN